MDNGHKPILSVRNLKTYFFQDEGTVHAVDGADFDVYKSKTLGIVGESGCGKSVTARSVLRIVERPGRIVEGKIWLHRETGAGHGDELDLAKVNPDGALDALNFMRQTISDGITNPNSTTYLEEDVRKILSEGKAAFTLNWTYVFAMANDPATSQVPGQIGIAPTPAGPAGPVGVSGSMGLSVTGSSTHPDQAWKLIDFLCSEANQKQYASDSLPIWTAALDAADLNASPELVAAAKVQFAAVKGRPEFVSWYNAFSTKLQVAIQKVLLGTQSAQEAMDPMLAEAEQLKSGQ